MSTSLAPMMAPTPASEKGSVYFDTNSASAEHLAHADGPSDTAPPTGKGGADVARKPSVATGALEQPRGGILTNKQDQFTRSGTDERGYISDVDTTDAAGGNPNSRGVPFPGSQQPHQPQRQQQPQQTMQRDPNYGGVESGPNYDGSAQQNQYVPYPTDHSKATGGDFSQTPRETNYNQQPDDSRYQSPGQTQTGAGNKRLSGAFAGGAALTGPSAMPDNDEIQHQRAATAESGMSEEAKARVARSELKDAKRISKVIKAEGRTQDQNLQAALSELGQLQKVQKQAASDESRALSAHTKSTDNEHRLHTKFISVKAAHERAEADLRASEEQLGASRARAQAQTQALATKTREIEELRRAKGVDDREREAKLREFSQMGKKSKSRKFF
ncbi:hypothetical protein M0805_007575 [Coniferiporia weirii]|nr:hypothetical protein M0805_007575 [Coniferiporia weirii]